MSAGTEESGWGCQRGHGGTAGDCRGRPTHELCRSSVRSTSGSGSGLAPPVAKSTAQNTSLDPPLRVAGRIHVLVQFLQKLIHELAQIGVAPSCQLYSRRSLQLVD